MPLDWKEPSQDFKAFTAEVKGGLEPSTLRSAFCDAWRFLISAVIPLNRENDWDHIRFEFWLDSGRCEIFVAHSDKTDSVARGCCRLVSRELASIWDRCATEYSHSDDEFVRALIDEEKKFVILAVESADLVAREEAALRGVEVEFWNADSEHLDSYIIG